MSIDAVIVGIRREPDRTMLTLAPRRERDGTLSIAGRSQLYITKNPNYEPQIRDEIWGNTSQVMIGDHEFSRLTK
jgi:hypothetical protein